MSSRLLVPLDGSADAAAAMAPARALADETGADLVLMRVVESELSTPGDELTTEASTYLATVAADVAASGRRVALVVAQGDPAAEIVREARGSDVNMIVMGAHGRAGATEPRRCGVADAVARTASCPVLLFRASPDGTTRLMEAALDRPVGGDVGEIGLVRGLAGEERPIGRLGSAAGGATADGPAR